MSSRISDSECKQRMKLKRILKKMNAWSTQEASAERVEKYVCTHDVEKI